MTDTRFTHRSVEGATATEARFRPEPGAVTILPDSAATPVFVEAVEAAGGRVVPLGAETRGLVWLANSDPDGLLAALEQQPRVQWVQLPWAGVDAFASALASHDRDDLLWTSAKGAYAQPVAEHALMLILAGLRGVTERARATSWGEKKGGSLYGRRVVIVGAGGIAVELLRLLAPFDTSVAVVRRSPGDVPGAERTVLADELDTVLPDADVVVLAAASTEETRHLIGSAQLALVKPDAVLVNIARGALVDTEALVAALREGRLLFAGLDVTAPEPLPDGHPLWDEPRALITPHSADTPEMIEPLLAARVRENVAAFLSNGRFIGVVDPSAGY